MSIAPAAAASMEKFAAGMAKKGVAENLAKFGMSMKDAAESGVMEKLNQILDKILSIMGSPFVVAVEQIMNYISASTSEASARAIKEITELLASEGAQTAFRVLGATISITLNGIANLANFLDNLNEKWKTLLDIVVKLWTIF